MPEPASPDDPARIEIGALPKRYAAAVWVDAAGLHLKQEIDGEDAWVTVHRTEALEIVRLLARGLWAMGLLPENDPDDDGDHRRLICLSMALDAGPRDPEPDRP